MSDFITIANKTYTYDSGVTYVQFDLFFTASTIAGSKIEGAVIDLDYNSSSVSVGDSGVNSPTYGTVVIKPIWKAVEFNPANGKIAMAADTGASNPIISTGGKTLSVTLVVSGNVTDFPVSLQTNASSGVNYITTADTVKHEFDGGVMVIPPPSLADVVVDLMSSSDSGTLATDDITNVITPTVTVNLTGKTLTEGHILKIVDTSNSNTVVGSYIITAQDVSSALASKDITLSTLSGGVHALKAQFSSSSGTTVGTASATATTVTVDTAAPASLASVVVDLKSTSDSGSSTTDDITNAITPTVTVTLTGKTLVTGDIVQIIDTSNGNAVVGTHTVTSQEATSGITTQDITLSTLVAGVHALKAQLIDLAGNAGTVSTTATTVTVDTTKPVFTSSATGSVNENANVATIIYTASATDNSTTLTYSLSGTDANLLNINPDTGAVTLKNSADYESSQKSYSFTVSASDGANSEDKSIVVSVTDVNEAPTAVALNNKTTSIAENTSTTTHIKVADIAVTDDAPGTNSVTLSGADANSFEVVGTALYLKAGETLNYEAKNSYAVTVNVADSTVAGSSAVTSNYTLTVTDVNEAPTAVALNNAITSMAENTSTTTHLKVADIAITDDVPGTNAVTLSGADANSFEVVGTALYLKAGETLNYEAKNSYAVTVNVADSTVAGSSAVTSNYTLTKTDVNEAPAAVALNNATTSIAENTNTTTHIKVAEIAITDDALTSNNAVTLSGTDANSFEVVGTALYLKAGETLNYEAKNSYAVTVNVADSTVTGSSAVTTNYALTVTDVNEAPTAVALNNATTSIAENTSTTTHIKVAEIAITDDALTSNNAVTLSGADANSFEVVGTALHLKAGETLDYEAKNSYAVTVNVADSTVNGSSAVTTNYTLTVTNVNDPHTGTATVSGQPAVGATLTADISTLGDQDGLNNIAYQWQANGLDINGATSSTLVLDAAQTNLPITVKVTYTDSFGNTTVTSAEKLWNQPPAISVTNATVSLAENAAAGEIGIQATATDAENDPVTLSLVSPVNGTNDRLFTMDSSGNISLTAAGAAALNYESSDKSYTLTVTASDAAHTGASATTKTVTVNITDVNEAPTAVALNNLITSIAENTSTTTHLKVADIAITDDAPGINAVTLSGADANSFEVVGTALYLKAGETLNYEAKNSYAVTVNVADSTVAGSSAVTTNYALTVTDVNEAPTAVVLNNAITSIAENTSTTTHIKVADIAVTDDAPGTNAVTLSGTDASRFEVVGTALYLKAGETLNYEAKNSYAVTVNVADSTVAGSSAVTSNYTLTVTDVNEAPTAVALNNATTSIAENTSTSTHIKVADIAVTDDAPGTNAVTLSGADASRFEVVGTALSLKAGETLNYEAKNSYAVTVNVADSSVNGSSAVTSNYTLTVTDVNEAPTAVALNNTTTSIAENTSTTTHIKVADIAITDDAPGTNAVTLTGADVNSFEIVGTELYLKAGVTLNYEAKNSYAVTVNVADSSVNGSSAVTSNYTLTVTDVNEAPTAVALNNATTNIAENTSTTTHIKVADIAITDDAPGTNAVTLTGADVNSFEIVGTELFLKAGATLNYEATKNSYAVTVNVADSTVAGSSAVTSNYTLTVTDVNEAPTAVALNNATTSIAENTSTTTHIKVADIAVTDDALVSNNAVTLTGADANSFEVVGTALYLKAGETLNYEAKQSYVLTVNVADSTVTGSSAVTTNYALTVTDVNEAPSAVVFNNATTSIAENTSTTTHIKVADIAVTDDALGTNTVTLSGTDANSFEVVGTELYLKAGETLNYEAPKNSYAVTVNVADSSVNGSSAVTTPYTLNVTNVNDLPTGLTIDGTLTEGQTVEAKGVADEDGLGSTFYYQWKAGSDVIAGATSNTLLLDSSQVGKAITVKVSYTDGHGTPESISTATTANVAASFKGVALDGYLSNALVWVDSNPDGKLNWNDTNSNNIWDQGETATESWTITDASGQFSGLVGTGKIMMTGNPVTNTTTNLSGTQTRDISTGKPFTGSYSAPAGSTVVNPLTTLVVAEMARSTSDASTAAASVKTALGLDTIQNLDLTTYDALAETVKTGGDDASAIKVQSAATQVANIMDIATSVAEGASSTKTATEIAQSVATSLMTTANSGTLDVTNTTVINDAITDTVAGVDAAVVSSIADASAAVNSKISSISNGSGTTAETLTQIVAAQLVAQETLAGQAKSAVQTTNTGAVTVSAGNIDQAVTDKVDSVKTIIPNYLPTGEVTIKGAVTQGHTLTVSNTLADIDVIPTDAIHYQWLENGDPVSGATGLTYTLTANDVDKLISVVASYTDGAGHSNSKVSSASPVLAQHAPTGSVTITGTVINGHALVASHNIVDADGPGSIIYQWYSGSTAISEATLGNTLGLSNAQEGDAISVKASYVDGHGTAESVSSDTIPYGATLSEITHVTTVNELNNALGNLLMAFPSSDFTIGTDVEEGIAAYYNSLATATDVVVRSVIVTAAGTLDVSASAHEALVIDITAVPPDSVLNLNNVDFAIIIGNPGNVTIRGGAGNNIVFAGSGHQDIVLGTGDDILHGGDGDDNIASLDGIDQLYGDADNDTLTGGTGNDTLYGGAGDDTAVFSGNFADYTISFNKNNSSYTLHDNTDNRDGEDVVTGVEYFKFGSSDPVPVDITDPTLESVNPGNAATAVAVGSNIVFTFSENVVNGGGIEVHAGSATGAVVQASATVSGKILTIDPVSDLSNSTHYYVTFADGSIHDLYGHSYAGTTYDFTTADPYAAQDGNGRPSPEAVLAGVGGLGLLAWILF